MRLSFCTATVLVAALIVGGCGRSPQSAREHFVKVAKEMGDGPTAEHVIRTVEKQYENGDPFAWSDLDRFMAESTPETIAAYKEWRDAMIAAHRK